MFQKFSQKCSLFTKRFGGNKQSISLRGAKIRNYKRKKSSFDLGPAGPSSVSCFASFGAFFRSVCTFVTYVGCSRVLHLEHLEGHNPVGTQKDLLVPRGQARCKSSQLGKNQTPSPQSCGDVPF